MDRWHSVFKIHYLPHIVVFSILTDRGLMLHDSGGCIDKKGIMEVLSKSSAAGEEKIPGAV